MTQEKRDEVFDKVASIIVELTSVDRAQLSPEKELRALGIDSLDGLEILGEVEDAFGISVTNKDARSLVTLGDMVDGIIRLQADGSSDLPEREKVITAFDPKKAAQVRGEEPAAPESQARPV